MPNVLCGDQSIITGKSCWSPVMANRFYKTASYKKYLSNQKRSENPIFQIVIDGIVYLDQ